MIHPMRPSPAGTSKATAGFWLSAAVVALVSCIALRNVTLWYERPIPGLLIDASGAVSSIGLPDWAAKRLGLQYPDLVAPAQGEKLNGGSKRRVEVWDDAVWQARSRPYLDALVTKPGGERKAVRLPMRPLEPAAWWVYGASCIFAGVLYAGAGLVALWARPAGRLARAFARFGICSGLFLLTLFDIHTERALTAVFFVTYAVIPPSLLFVMLHLPVSTPLLARHPRLETAVVLAAASLGLTTFLVHWTGGDVVPFQVLLTALFGIALAISVGGFLTRYARSRGEQQRTLRALLISMIPPYAGTSVAMLLASRGVLRGFPDFLLFPAFLFAPLASLYAFVRYDLWGSRVLLSRIGTSLVVGGLACAVAIAAGAALATWTGATFTHALAGAAGGGIAAAVLVVLALRVSDFTLFRSRAEYKPTIEKLGEELTTLTSAAEVSHAIESTVRRWLPCEFIRLTLAPSEPQNPLVDPADGLNGAVEPDPESGPTDRAKEPPRDSSSELRMEVSFAGKALGWLDVGAKRGGALFTSDDMDLLRAIANHGGLALAHAHAYQELEDRRQAQAQAWRGEREALVETVAAEMAHEIRYPINYFRTLFERSASGAKLGVEDIEVGREEVDRLERLVSGLKRMAAHRIERSPTAVSELCTRVEALLRDSLGKRPIELDIGNHATLRCDPDKMTQVLVNLLSNGLEACGPNGRIGVEWTATQQGGELRVWDDGPGFVGEASRLFAPWYTTKPRGTGLGLAITHRLVRAHGWNVAGGRRDSRTVFTVSVRQEDIVRDSARPRPRPGAPEARVA
jgi:signal transduction histidine kinase